MMDFDAIGWLAAEGDFNGNPVWTRHRTFDTRFPKQRYPIMIRVYWRMSQPAADGLLTPTELEAVQAFEDRLVDAVESDNHSVLSMVITMDGYRTFLFHTADVAGFLERLGEMPQEGTPYPIELERVDDPEWEYFTSMTESILQ